MAYWFERREALRQLPLLWQLLALYFRIMHNPGTGMALGGARFIRRLVQLTRRLRLPAVHPIQTREGNTLYLDLTDERIIYVLDEALSDGNHEASVIRAVLREGDTFIDIGANHGTYSLLAAQLVSQQGTVIAIEPQPRKAKLIERSLRASGFSSCEVVQVACGAEEGQVSFFVPRNSGGAGVHESFSGTPSHERMTVPMVTLESLDIPFSTGSTFVKLDVEGSELATLKGASSFLRRRRPLIMLELHPGSAAAAGSSIDELLTFLEEHKYEYSRVEHFRETVDRGQIDKTVRHNIVAIPADEQQRA